MMESAPKSSYNQSSHLFFLSKAKIQILKWNLNHFDPKCELSVGLGVPEGYGLCSLASV